MKTIKKRIAFIFLVAFTASITAQNAFPRRTSSSTVKEKRIKFNKGVLKICTSSRFTIKGYDGDEVVIKSNNPRGSLYRVLYDQKKGQNVFTTKKDSGFTYRVLRGYNSGDKEELEKGLKPLGTKSADPADNLFLDIQQKSGELVIKDYKTEGQGGVYAANVNSYELLIPNTVKLFWNTDNCKKNKQNSFFAVTSKPWELSNFKGEVEISSSYGSITLTDVSGPVLANTLGGNIKVIFKNASPKNLYSLISNDGNIDIELPPNSNLKIDATGRRILSDLDFKVDIENIVDDTKYMVLRLNGGSVKMKLDAGYGNIYLRKK